MRSYLLVFCDRLGSALQQFTDTTLYFPTGGHPVADTDESNITEIQKKDDGYSLDQEAAARRLAENFNKYDVISDDELMVEDGETSEEDLNDAYAELFLKDEKEDFLKVTPIDKLQEKEVTVSKREIDIIKSLSFMVHNIKDLDTLLFILN